MFGDIKKLLRKKTAADLAEKQLKRIKLKKTDISIDCGANVGSYTKYLAKKNSTVYAFEPNPYAFGVLSNRFKMRSNVYCINKGVGEKAGTMKLYLHKNAGDDPLYWSQGSSFLTVSNGLNYDSSLNLEIIDLCEFIVSLHSRIRVLKMDIEGMEYEVLKKLIETEVIHMIDYVFVEVHENYPEFKLKADDLRDIIKTKQINNINLDWK